jgi:serine protease Do
LLDESEQTAQHGPSSPAASATQTPRLGLSVRPLTPAERRGVQTEGHLVVEQAQGPAAAAGLQPGDIILAVGDKPVTSVDELRKAAEDSRDIALLIQRQDQRIYVPIRVG